VLSFHPAPERAPQGIPADLEAVAMRLLAHDRAERYPTAELAAPRGIARGALDLDDRR
jgi:hypothetical protein